MNHRMTKAEMIRRSDMLDLRSSPKPTDEACPYCGHQRLHGRDCKVWCDQCGNLIRTCSDL